MEHSDFCRVTDSELEQLESQQSGGSSSESYFTLKLEQSMKEGTFGNDLDEVLQLKEWLNLGSLALQSNDSGAWHNQNKIASDSIDSELLSALKVQMSSMEECKIEIPKMRPPLPHLH